MTRGEKIVRLTEEIIDLKISLRKLASWEETDERIRLEIAKERLAIFIDRAE